MVRYAVRVRERKNFTQGDLDPAIAGGAGASFLNDDQSCATRDQLGGYLLQALDESRFDYIEFHLKTIGCPFCQANLDDLQKKQAEAAEPIKARRRRIVNSSAGVLRTVTGPG